MIVSNHWWISLHQILLHVCVTALAIGIAFSLPVGASYILYQWWPIVAEDANLLMASEVVLAGMLVLLFNMAGIAWANRSKVRMTDLASLVHVRQSDSWLARWRERRLVKPLPAVRDGFVLTITGFDTFADEKSLLGEALNNAYEIRVMLLNPHGEGAGKRVDSLPEQITRQNFISEVESSIAHLNLLRTMGKKVSLKFYEHEPFWKIVVLGDHVWVQHCHSGCEVKREPEYVFALNREHPRRGRVRSRVAQGGAEGESLPELRGLYGGRRGPGRAQGHLAEAPRHHGWIAGRATRLRLDDPPPGSVRGGRLGGAPH